MYSRSKHSLFLNTVCFKNSAYLLCWLFKVYTKYMILILKNCKTRYSCKTTNLITLPTKSLHLTPFSLVQFFLFAFYCFIYKLIIVNKSLAPRVILFFHISYHFTLCATPFFIIHYFVTKQNISKKTFFYSGT